MAPVIRPSSRDARATPEKDRRFALLVAMMIPPGRRALRWRRSSAIGFAQGREHMMSDERPVVTKDNEDRIRQGVTGHNVRYVVIVSVALVIVVFIMVAVIFRP